MGKPGGNMCKKAGISGDTEPVHSFLETDWTKPNPWLQSSSNYGTIYTSVADNTS